MVKWFLKPARFWELLWLVGASLLVIYLTRGAVVSLFFGWFEWWSNGFTHHTLTTWIALLVGEVGFFYVMRQVNNFMPWLLFGLIPSMLLAWFTRHYRLTALLAISSILIESNFVPLFLPRPTPTLATNSPSLKVMSYNVWYYNEHTSYTSIAKVIKQVQPDILLLQELELRGAWHLRQELSGLYPNDTLYFIYEDKPLTELSPGSELYKLYDYRQRPRRRNFTLQAIISRYPLKAQGVDQLKSNLQKVQVETPNGTIAVWNVHTPHPLGWYLWQHQYRRTLALSRDIAQTDSPLIVGGDFNATAQSEVYHLVSQYLHDTHQTAGWGYGFTFPTPNRDFHFYGIPVPSAVMRLDYLFYNDYFQVVQANTLSDSGGSDHFPIVAELRSRK